MSNKSIRNDYKASLDDMARDGLTGPLPTACLDDLLALDKAARPGAWFGYNTTTKSAIAIELLTDRGKPYGETEIAQLLGELDAAAQRKYEALAQSSDDSADHNETSTRNTSNTSNESNTSMTSIITLDPALATGIRILLLTQNPGPQFETRSIKRSAI